MKLCKDCAHAREVFVGGLAGICATWEGAKCAHPNMLSPVDGHVVAFCEVMRIYQDCGKDAKLFEQRDGPDPAAAFNEEEIARLRRRMETEKEFQDWRREVLTDVKPRGFFKSLFWIWG